MSGSDGLRTHQAIFAAGASGVPLAGVAFALLAPVGNASPGTLEGLFFASAALTLLGTYGAYRAQETLITRLAEARTRGEALELLLMRGLWSAACLEAPALLALVGFLLSADASFVLFAVPFLVGVTLLFPTEGRVRERLAAAGH
jgi:hypothetical protein